VVGGSGRSGLRAVDQAGRVADATGKGFPIKDLRRARTVMVAKMATVKIDSSRCAFRMTPEFGLDAGATRR
jgi:hypothetical protein